MKINHQSIAAHWFHYTLLSMCICQVVACADTLELETNPPIDTDSGETITQDGTTMIGSTDTEASSDRDALNGNEQATASDSATQQANEQDTANGQESSVSSDSIEEGRFIEQGNTMDFSGNLSGQGAVEILNIQGDIEFRLSANNELRIQAEKSSEYSDVADVRLEVVVSEGWITACAMYPDVQGMPANRCESDGTSQLNAEDSDVTVRWVVSLPASYVAVARNVTGNILATGMTQPVDVATVTGSITIETIDIAFAETVSGNIFVSMDPALSDEYGFDTLLFSAVNGSVDVKIPSSANVDFLGTSVSRSVNTEFGLANEGTQRVEGSINGGGPLIQLTSVSGDVVLGKQ
jgi:hypothetical protein